MAKYNVHAGHNKKCPGASKLLDEVTEDRKVKNRVIELLELNGHTVYDCTDDDGKNSTTNLTNIVNKCNKHTVSFDISIHLNAGGGTGVEVWTYSSDSKANACAKRICSKVSSALGIKNRGVKHKTTYYVLRKTKNPAMIVECCFVDNATDKKAWDADKCAEAIVKGILNKSTITTEKATATATSSSGSSSSSSDVLYKVKVTADVLNIRAGAGTSYKITGTIKDKGTYSIVKESGSWGKLKSGAGWINLNYTKKVS